MRVLGRLLPAWALLLATHLPLSAQAEDPKGRVPSGKDVALSVAPVLPGEILQSLQAGKYAEAADALAKLEAQPDTKPADAAYFRLVHGIALKLGKSYDDARSTLEKALKDDPDGPWTAKLRSELAAVEIAAGRFATAEKMAREQAEHLLDGDRKDRLAGVFQDFADRLLHPDQPTTPPDPEGAFALLQQARELAEGHALRAKLLLANGPGQPAGRQSRPRHRKLSGVPERIPQG